MLQLKLITQFYQYNCTQLNEINNWLPQLALRLILAWEFGESGFEKLHGTNWFADLAFPFPFNLLPHSISWNISIFFEVVGAFALVIGFAARFFSISLIILTIVAIISVHWPDHYTTFSHLLQGYRIIDKKNDGFGNYKLPLMYIVMFLPLLFGGSGKASIDYWLIKKCQAK